MSDFASISSCGYCRVASAPVSAVVLYLHPERLGETHVACGACADVLQFGMWVRVKPIDESVLVGAEGWRRS